MTAADGCSTILLEKIAGQSLADAAPTLADPPAFARFAAGCLDLLDALRRAGITHRDINLDNILVREGRPILLDFGWAVSDVHPFFTPPHLGLPFRAPEGPVCDTFAMANIMAFVAAGRYPALQSVLRLMMHPDPAARLRDLPVLRELFAAALAAPPAGRNTP